MEALAARVGFLAEARKAALGVGWVEEGLVGIGEGLRLQVSFLWEVLLVTGPIQGRQEGRRQASALQNPRYNYTACSARRYGVRSIVWRSTGALPRHSPAQSSSHGT